MTLKTHCTPRASVFQSDRRATVLNLDTFLDDKVDGAEFFAENYFTNGMQTLMDRAFRHLADSTTGVLPLRAQVLPCTPSARKPDSPQK